jgi:hypothetical protein
MSGRCNRYSPSFLQPQFKDLFTTTNRHWDGQLDRSASVTTFAALARHRSASAPPDFGELLGGGLRIFSGPWADATEQYWPIIALGYVIQMASVPPLALTGSWPAAAG